MLIPCQIKRTPVFEVVLKDMEYYFNLKESQTPGGVHMAAWFLVLKLSWKRL